MKYAKFNKNGVLVILTDNAPNVSVGGMVPVPSNIAHANIYLDQDGIVKEREPLAITCTRTVLASDNPADFATIKDLPSGCVLSVNGDQRVAQGGKLDVSSDSPLLIESVGRYQSNTLYVTTSTTQELADQVRTIRNDLLLKSDWTQFPNAPLTEEQKALWDTYRQALRDIFTDNPDVNIDTVVWPKQP